MLRMVLTEACRGTAHEEQIERADLDAADAGSAAHWIASHYRMLDPFSDCGEEDSNRWTDDRADLDRWALRIKREEERVCRARAALQKLREQL
eukprot:7776368-Lingulodinium_polyedra.AAC.1